jgi:hypothetical protein
MPITYAKLLVRALTQIKDLRKASEGNHYREAERIGRGGGAGGSAGFCGADFSFSSVSSISVPEFLTVTLRASTSTSRTSIGPSR